MSPAATAARSDRKRFHQRDSVRQLAGIALVVVFCLMGEPLLPLWIVGTCLATLGIGVRLWASGHIKKNRELATDGPYAFVRHPLYVGNLLLAAGFCLASGLWWSVPVMLVFLGLFYPTAIRDEDAKLEGLFGEEWRRWRAATRALVPRLTPYPGGGDGEGSEWSLAYSLRLNGEPLIALFLFGCLGYLYSKLV